MDHKLFVFTGIYSISILLRNIIMALRNTLHLYFLSFWYVLCLKVFSWAQIFKSLSSVTLIQKKAQTRKKAPKNVPRFGKELFILKLSLDYLWLLPCLFTICLFSNVVPCLIIFFIVSVIPF